MGHTHTHTHTRTHTRTHAHTQLMPLLAASRVVAVLLSPIVPVTSRKVCKSRPARCASHFPQGVLVTSRKV